MWGFRGARGAASASGRQGFGDPGRGGGQRGRPSSASRRFGRLGRRWTRGRSFGPSQGQTHEDFHDSSASRRRQTQTQDLHLHLSPTPAADLDEVLRQDQFGEYLEFVSTHGNEPIAHLKTLCSILAEQLLTDKRRLAQLEPLSPVFTSSPPPATELASFVLPMGASTPVLDQFLREIGNIFHQRDGTRLQDVLQLEPPLPPAYSSIVSELRMHFPKGQDQALLTRCEQVIPVAEDGVGSAWGAFPDFLARYFRFLRDADPSNLPDLYEKLKSLTNQAIICLSETTNGVIILPTVLYLSKVLAKVALGLDKNPELVADILKDQKAGDPEGAAEKVTFVETASNVLREAFIKCITDKSGGGGGRRATPENKRTGIYMTANSCLKLLFQCRKSRNAQQMFASIDAQSPLLSHYPAAQRVTYLYYLGRYMFANSHFYRAHLALDSAYQQCHAQALRQRQHILTYLIASNICLGRFPASKLLMRREASELAKRFLPLCSAIARGDLTEFGRLVSVDSEHGQWFLQKRVLLQLRSTCEILVWRSLVRKVFILVGFLPQGDDNKMPFLRLSYVQAAVRWLEERKKTSVIQRPQGNFSETQTNGSYSSTSYIDEEFDGIDEAVAEHGFDVDTGYYHDDNYSADNMNGHVVVGAEASEMTNGTGTTASGDGHGDDDDDDYWSQPTMAEIESVMASMLQQGLLNGFLTHTNPRFAVPGSKAGGGALKVAFPNIWQTVTARSTDQVPGWVRE